MITGSTLVAVVSDSVRQPAARAAEAVLRSAAYRVQAWTLPRAGGPSPAVAAAVAGHDAVLMTLTDPQTALTTARLLAQAEPGSPPVGWVHCDPVTPADASDLWAGAEALGLRLELAVVPADAQVAEPDHWGPLLLALGPPLRERPDTRK